MENKFGIIYKITCIVNKKIYIGQTTTTLKRRWGNHCSVTGGSPMIHNAIKKYGKENFIIEQVDVANSTAELNQKEKYWIKFYSSNDRERGFNLTDGGEDGRKILNEHEEQEIVKMWQSGISAKDIAKKFDVSIGPVYSVKQKFGLESRVTTVHFSDQEKKQIKLMLAQNHTHEHIAKFLNRRTSVISNYCLKNGLKPNHKKEKTNIEKEFEIIKLLKETSMSIREIARKTNVHKSSVARVIKRSGLKPNRPGTLTEDQKEKILALRDFGHSQTYIAKQIGTGQTMVSSFLRKQNNINNF